jgi:hypothetical protein
MRLVSWFSAPVTLMVLLGVACDDGSSELVTAAAIEASVSSEATALPVQTASSGNETAAMATAEVNPYSFNIMNFQARNFFAPDSEIDLRGFEFVVGAPREVLLAVAAMTVVFPDGETRELRPSGEVTELGGPPDFFGYYGTGGDPYGLLPAGDYVLRIEFNDGSVKEFVHRFDGRAVDIARNVVMERIGNELHVSWDPVEGARNYSADLYESRGGTTDRDTFIGCPAENDPRPEYWLTTSSCVIEVPEGALVTGQQYLLIVATNGFDDTDPLNAGKSASFSGHQALLLTW